MSFPSFALVVLAAVLAVPPCAGAQVLTQKDVSARMAWTIIEAATAHCEKEGYSITVAVVDRVGRLRAYLQGDKASLANIELVALLPYFGWPSSFVPVSHTSVDVAASFWLATRFSMRLGGCWS